MRPDEHKKKKNTAYKKKHGIASNKSSNETASSVSSDKANKKNVETKRDKKHLGLQQPTPALYYRAKSQAGPVSSDEASDSEDGHQKTPKRKQFSRREIVSNWQKYEMELEEEEKVKAKGEKYEVLLGMAGEAMSRFRFRDELEWEDEHSNEDSNGMGEQQSHLQLNPSDLMQSLSCIPVHQILGLDEELFPKDQLESILQTAAMNQAMYSPKDATDLQENHSVPLAPTLCNTNPDEAILHMNSNHHKEDAKLISSKSHSSSNEIDQTSEPYTYNCRATKNSESGNKSPSEANPPKFTQALGLQDDDLDRLLDMDLDPKEIAADTTDSLTASSAQAISKEENEDKAESENLEEWLDSILD